MSTLSNRPVSGQGALDGDGAAGTVSVPRRRLRPGRVLALLALAALTAAVVLHGLARIPDAVRAQEPDPAPLASPVAAPDAASLLALVEQAYRSVNAGGGLPEAPDAVWLVSDSSSTVLASFTDASGVCWFAGVVAHRPAEVRSDASGQACTVQVRLEAEAALSMTAGPPDVVRSVLAGAVADAARFVSLGLGSPGPLDGFTPMHPVVFWSDSASVRWLRLDDWCTLAPVSSDKVVSGQVLVVPCVR